MQKCVFVTNLEMSEPLKQWNVNWLGDCRSNECDKYPSGY